MRAFNTSLLQWITKNSLLLAALFAAGTSTAQTPYTPGSGVDNLLKFSASGSNNATAPLPALTLVLATETATDAKLGGGWNIEASGSTNIGLTQLITLASSRARTAIGPNSLSFQTVNAGTLSELFTAGIGMQWRASTTLTGSQTWEAGRYGYQFDLNIDTALLNLNPNVLGSFSLTISDNNSTLFNGSIFGDILDITSLSASSYLDVTAEFDYDPVNGPLYIAFNASAPINANLLNLTGTGTSTLYNVSGADIVIIPVPEPSGALLLGASGLLLIMRRRRDIG